jgi:TonB-linked SusC/RagA family outer membrane protein
MRFHHILLQRFRFLILLLLCVFLTGTLIAQDKPGKKVITVSVSLKVVDDNGIPIPKAKVIIGEGVIHAMTDENGAYSFMAFPDDYITISAPGYEKNVSSVEKIIESNTVKLSKAKLFMTSDDDIPLPYMTQKKRHITGSSNVVTGDQLEKYPSTDIRNAFTGLVPGLQITEYNGSTGISPEEKLGVYRITEKIGVSARGRSMTYIIDNTLTDITETPLDPSEIESVTVIKDIVGKTMYGPIGADGIIFIKTKRGKANERILNVNLEDGVAVIDRFPGWVSGAEYATLNNQARENDLLKKNYLDSDISAYSKNDPYDMYHPSVNFKDMMLKNTKAFRRANVSSSGGNEMVQYSAYLGYDGDGDIYSIGPIADYNRISSRANIDIKINDLISVQFDISAGLSYRRSSNYGYTSTVGETGSQMDILEFSSALPNIINTPPIAFPVYANNDPSLKAPWYGVSAIYPINPIGNLVANGYYTERGRTGAIKASFNYDMSNLIKGLKSKTFINFDALNLVRIGKAEDYIAYIATPSISPKTGNDTILLKKAHDGVVASDLANLHDYYYQRFSFFETLSYERSFDVHNIQSSLTYFFFNTFINGITEPRREQLGVWTTKYSYRDKYIIQGVLNYAGTFSFTKEKRTELFPAIGASWVISEESFMSNLKAVNYLKLHAEAGVLGYESFMAPYYYRDRWTLSTGNSFGPYTSGTKWVGSTNETSPYINYPSRIGNPDLGWEKRKEVSIGIDGLIFSNKLSFEVNYYNNLRDGQIVQLSNSVPYVLGISSTLPYFNYNKTRYFGWETGIQFTDNSEKFGYSIGGNATVQNSKIEKYSEPEYRFDYQFMTGKPGDTYWGQTYIGKFASDAEALEVPQIFDAVLKTGDLKYKDMNGDGFIDDNDVSAIGHTSPRLFYALNAKFNFKNFDITIIGTGCAFFDIPLTNPYYWNGWSTTSGDPNYSNFVRDNIGGSYPRLTYYKVNNNFVNSDFWLTKGDYFKIQNIELAYNLPTKILQSIHAQGIRFYIRGANLLTISQVKDVDPESINSGVTLYPLYKTFTGGIKLTF